MKHEIGVAGFNILYRKICSAAYAFIPQLGSHTHKNKIEERKKLKKMSDKSFPLLPPLLQTLHVKGTLHTTTVAAALVT